MSKPLTQRDRVLYLLREAGSAGVRSDVFLAHGMPRAAARIGELEAMGYEITHTREGKYTRYTLTGLSAESGGRESSSGLCGAESGEPTGVDAAAGAQGERSEDEPRKGSLLDASGLPVETAPEVGGGVDPGGDGAGVPVPQGQGGSLPPGGAPAPTPPAISLFEDDVGLRRPRFADPDQDWGEAA